MTCSKQTILHVPAAGIQHDLITFLINQCMYQALVATTYCLASGQDAHF
jgi:hypothetical protein